MRITSYNNKDPKETKTITTTSVESGSYMQPYEIPEYVLNALILHFKDMPKELVPSDAVNIINAKE